MGSNLLSIIYPTVFTSNETLPSANPAVHRFPEPILSKEDLMAHSGEARWREAVRHMLLTTRWLAMFQYIVMIPYLPLEVRKQLLKCARAQSSLRDNPFLLSQTTVLQKVHYKSFVYEARISQGTSKNISMADLIYKITDECIYPIFSGLLSVLLRSAPIFMLSEVEVSDNKRNSFLKEYFASIDQDRDQVLDYSVWFDKELSGNPLSHFLPPRPINSRIAEIFSNWRQMYQENRIILFPQLTGTRSISRMSAYLYHQAHGRDEIEWKDVTPIDLERTYAETGKVVGGPCELRQAWKYNDLTPRTYFALGGTAFHGSKFIRSIANGLCNLFPSTNFMSRFDVNRLQISKENEVFTYDYTSFTSNLTETKYFLLDLAEFMKEAPVVIVDSFYGPIDTTVGDILLEYIQTCVSHPSFMVNRFLDGFYEEIIHNKSGMLGVYGNISLSTGLHGLHACNLCPDGDCNCVGDDVIGSTDLDRDDFFSAVGSLGSISVPKTRFWEYRGIEEDQYESRKWPYTKRPLERIENFLLHHVAYSFPIFGLLIPIVDGIHEIESEEILLSHYRLLSVQCKSLVKQIRAYPDMSMDERELLLGFVGFLYKEYRIPEEGRFPWDQIRARDGVRYGLHIPPLAAYVTGNLNEGMGEAFEPGVHRVPMTTVVDEKISFCPSRLETSRSGLCHGHMMLGYGEKLGWLVREKAFVQMHFDSLDSYTNYASAINRGHLLPLYDVQIHSVPVWFFPLLIEQLPSV